MQKNIVVRGKKDLVAVFSMYAKISGEQDTSRPRATECFVKYISDMPLDEITTLKLKNASKQHIDNSAIADDSIPSFIKLSIEVEEATWEKAMNVFRYVFSLNGNPQMPYFLRVAGTAYIRDLEEQDSVSITRVQKISDIEKSDKILTLEQFQTLNIDKKLNEVYKLLLLERGV